MQSLDFSGKKYVVFGASSGIGRQTALQLSMLGAKLVLIGRNENKLQQTYERLSGSNHHIIICDISDFNAAKTVVKKAVELDGEKLDGCVFSAGIYTMLPIGMANETKINQIFATNAFSLMAIIKTFSSKRISNDGAAFVSVSSRAGFLPDKSQGVYAASKAAINSYTIAAAKEMAIRRIRFNTVCPEAVDTEMGAGLKQSFTSEALAKIYPLGMLEAEDVANAILFLLSDLSKKISGQSIWLSAGNDGGSIEGHIF
ncbi:MAG: SDR family oxidoreductase [Phascolarctobacterium sp.]|uniref:SDR family NAD(P)-dependent oxidoreductase n=1 Tax=Phascolarctobacterium sp. TaxID=2049039 RepID=UPI0026DD0087|nr:SDR family oxidoreductase [Phascolarctobacterium sp.]MDO4922256.1 SDR family oxidoreductase [Phascolarctobacterium sp.]